MRKPKVKKCVFCSPSFAVKKVKNKDHKIEGNGIMVGIANSRGLKCTRCGRYACLDCLRKIIEKIPKNKWDAWCRHVASFVKSNGRSKIEDGFVGHCCEHHITKKSASKNQDLNLSLPPTSIPAPQKGEHSNLPLCDGDLFLPEFDLLIQTSFVSVDIHALAPDRSTSLPGAWHATIPLPDAIEFQQKEIFPKPFDVSCATRIKKLKIALPWTEGSLEYVSYTVYLIFFFI